jgi:DNA replication protein DnaC
MAEAVCPHCGGSGWKIVEREGVSGAERCECAKEGRVERILKVSGIPAKYENATFDNFDTKDTDIAGQELYAARQKVLNYAHEFPLGSKPGLLIIGDTGRGKTHLAVAALRRIIGKGFQGVFLDYQTLLERIQSSFDSASGSTDKEVYRTALDAEVLLLDDLGARRTSAWVEDTVTSIVTHRYNDRKPLIATTNLPVIEAGDRRTIKNDDGTTDYRRTLVDYIGERALSRLFEMCEVVRIPGLVRDYRVRKAIIR